MQSIDKVKYLKLLSAQYPNAAAVGKEIILLESLLSLPKGAELFISDVHGEHESFEHVLRNGAGTIRRTLERMFEGEIGENDIRTLATLIYYPEEKVEILKATCDDINEFYETTLRRLVKVARAFSAIYATRKNDTLLPSDYGMIISELLMQRKTQVHKRAYYQQLIQTAIDIDEADKLIIAFARFIQRLSIHKVHLIGDIYDRGPGAEHIVDALMEHQSVDIQWGNHDIIWMGAACGSAACIANVIRLSLRYGNTNTLERGYGINLIPLASFAIEHYKQDESLIFDPKVPIEQLLNQSEHWLNRIMHKAMTIIQFKLEDGIISRRPDFELDNRRLLRGLDLAAGTVTIDSKAYPLNDTFFPTIDPANPTALTADEAALVEGLIASFQHSKRLQQHTRFLYEKGSMYSTTNNCLLYHGCIPLNDDGTLQSFTFDGQTLKGPDLLNHLDRIARSAYTERPGSPERLYGQDMMWYLWCGPGSPIFGKDKMATFERYFIDDTAARKEHKNAYYKYRDDEASCRMILESFGLDPDNSHILNGHVPVVVQKGESPVKANGKLFVIDGGFAKAYHKVTGIAGYSVIYDAWGMQLVAHQPFESTKKAIEEELDIASSRTVLQQNEDMLLVSDLDEGKRVREEIANLKDLLAAYKHGTIRQRYF